ncbi:MAG: hypothetical protein MUP47_04555 [Phycisphaerae bacterium]|nr:hypothetical protein [Phycisphaerae bacterium]
MSKAQAARWVCLGVLAAMPLGCQPGLGRLAWMFEPPQRVKALYTPPPGKTVLVFVDDVLNPVQYQPIKVELAARLNAYLIQKKLAADTVPYETLVEWGSKTADTEHLSVAEVGQAMGADLVLYVHLDKFSLKDDQQSPLWHGQMGTTIRLVDVKAGRLWPMDRPEGYAMPQVETASVDDSSPTYGTEVARELAEAMAERIVNVFCDHTVPADADRPKWGI